MKRFTNAVLILLVCLTTCAAALGQNKETVDREKIKADCQAILGKLQEGGDFTGAYAAIVMPDDEVVTVCIGTAYDEGKTPITPQSKMSSGSVGKTYFAALAMYLVSEGKIKLDDPVSKYLGKQDWFDRIPNAKDITIRHLLTHQSGIPRYVFAKEVWQTALEKPDEKWTGVEQLSFVFDKAPLHPAGKGWAYSDTGFVLMALALEKVTDKPLDDQIAEHFLKKHNLNDTLAARRGKIPNLVVGRCRLLKQFGIPERPVVDEQFLFNPTFEWAGGGYISTTSDLARWAKILWSGKAFDGDYVEAMVEDAPASDRFLGRGSRYGVGTMIRPTELGESLGHDGVFTGYLSATAYYPDHDISVAIQLTTDRPQDVGKPLHMVLTDLAKTVVGDKNTDN